MASKSDAPSPVITSRPIPAASLGRQIGRLLDAQEGALTLAIHAAFDLD